MLVYLLALLCLALLALLYHYIPNRKIFGCFCLTLLLVAGIAYFANQRQSNQPVMSEARKYELQQQQKIFTDWYAEYQKNVDEMDHNWQWYHNILENFKEQNIDIQTAYVRLKQLEEDSRLLRDRVYGLTPPQELGDECYDLCIALNQKAAGYIDAQCRTITLSRAASDPVHILTDDPAEQSRALQQIMIRESPEELFIADEISGIRNQLAIPEDDTPGKADE